MGLLFRSESAGPLAPDRIYACISGLLVCDPLNIEDETWSGLFISPARFLIVPCPEKFADFFSESLSDVRSSIAYARVLH